MSRTDPPTGLPRTVTVRSGQEQAEQARPGQPRGKSGVRPVHREGGSEVRVGDVGAHDLVGRAQDDLEGIERADRTQPGDLLRIEVMHLL